MGTRSLTFVYENDKSAPSNRLLCMYRQMDGYPSCHGKELAEFLASGKMVNGIGVVDQRLFNGMGCLAAQLVEEFKDGGGSIYLYPTATKDAWQDYEYHVYYNEVGGFKIIVKTGNTRHKTIFDGSLEEFTPWCVTTKD